jgi:hypothetical protein
MKAIGKIGELNMGKKAFPICICMICVYVPCRPMCLAMKQITKQLGRGIAVTAIHQNHFRGKKY